MATRTVYIDYNVSTSANFNTTPVNNETAYDHRWSFQFSVILATVLSISAFCTVVGNSMVLMVIIRHRGMRTRTNLFLVNLAVADLLVGLLVMPFSITTLLENRWIFGVTLCNLNGWMNSFCLITSFHTLMYISVHKYFSIVRPLSNPLKLSYILTMIAAAWLWAGIGSTLNIGVLEIIYKPGASQCGPRYPSNLKMFIAHGILQVTVIVIPGLILGFCYFRMFMEIRMHSQRLRTNSTVEEDFILSQQKKVAVTLFIVLATFVMMALPYQAYATYATIKKDKADISKYFNPLAYMFLYLSSMCNPIIYALRSPAFRAGYKEILCQTPNYVVSDDSELTSRTRRLSSIITALRRASTNASSGRNSLYYAENRSLTLDAPEVGDIHYKSKSGKQKSLFKLLRSTRQSTAQSVVHRNGDIIIMKGGKIVSVRRAGEGREGSPLLDRLKTLKETTGDNKGLMSGLAGSGQVMFGLVCEGVAEEDEELMGKRDYDIASVGSDDVFNAGSKVNSVYTNDDAPGLRDSGIGNSSLENSDTIKTQKRLHCDDADHNLEKCEIGEKDHTDKLLSNRNNFMSHTVEKLPCSNNITNVLSDLEFSENKIRGVLTDNKSSNFSKPCVDKSSATGEPLHSGCIVINVDDNDVLSVMPLTPHTREHLTKSDFYISHNTPGSEQRQEQLLLLKAHNASQSSENVFRKIPAVRRLPSLEFLDPPVHMFRSQSNVCMHSYIQQHKNRLKSPSSNSLSKSQEVKLGSKSLCLQSPFSSKKTITQL